MKIPKAKNASNEQPFYDFYRDGVTQSFINKFLTCKMQCKLEYVDGWTPKKEPIWFTYGKLIHHVLSKCYELQQVPNYSDIQHIILEYEKSLPQIATADMQTKEIIFGIAEMIIPVYFSKYADDFKRLHIHNESNFNVKCSAGIHFNKDIWISGRFDGAFLTPEYDCWILDTKCLSMIDEDLGSYLPFDTQVMLYCWAMHKLHPNYNIKGFIYNIVRRPMHKMTLKDTSIKVFCERVIKDIMSRMDEFFIRIQVPITLEEINDWEHKFLIPVLYEIERWSQLDYSSYVNSNALITKYGHCAMFDLITKSDTTNYYKREVPFGELI